MNARKTIPPTTPPTTAPVLLWGAGEREGDGDEVVLGVVVG
jgi:hypothetical protein